MEDYLCKCEFVNKHLSEIRLFENLPKCLNHLCDYFFIDCLIFDYMQIATSQIHESEVKS
jgi:hypothetical protein